MKAKEKKECEERMKKRNETKSNHSERKTIHCRAAITGGAGVLFIIR